MGISVGSSPPLEQNIQDGSKLGASLMSLSLTPLTLQQPPQQAHMVSFTFPTIFPRAIVELLGITPQRPREMTIRVTFSTHCTYPFVYIFDIIYRLFNWLNYFHSIIHFFIWDYQRRGARSKHFLVNNCWYICCWCYCV